MSKRQAARVSTKEKRVLAGLFLAGYTVRRYRSEMKTPPAQRDGHPGYAGWYWTRPNSSIAIGAFKTRREALEDITERELGGLP